MLRLRLVWRCGLYLWCNILQGTSHRSVLPWCCRGASVPGSRLPALVLVYSQGAWCTRRFHGHRRADRQRIIRSHRGGRLLLARRQVRRCRLAVAVHRPRHLRCRLWNRFSAHPPRLPGFQDWQHNVDHDRRHAPPCGSQDDRRQGDGGRRRQRDQSHHLEGPANVRDGLQALDHHLPEHRHLSRLRLLQLLPSHRSRLRLLSRHHPRHHFPALLLRRHRGCQYRMVFR